MADTINPYFDKLSVYIGDITDSEFNDMVEYCEEMGFGLVRYENMDVTDVTYRYDMLACFTFEKEEDAIIFKLRFN